MCYSHIFFFAHTNSHLEAKINFPSAIRAIFIIAHIILSHLKRREERIIKKSKLFFTEATNLTGQRGEVVKLLQEAFFSHMHICICAYNILCRHAATLTFTNVRSLNGYFYFFIALWPFSQYFTLSSMDEIFKWDNIMFMCFDIYIHYAQCFSYREREEEQKQKLTSYLNKKRDLIRFFWIFPSALLLHFVGWAPMSF